MILTWGALVAALGFPPAPVWPLALVAPAPLWALCLGASGRQAARWGWFFGLGFFTALLWWIVPTVVRYGGLGYGTGVATLLVLAAYLSLYPCLTGLLAAAISRRSVPAALAALPFAWTAAEWLRGTLLTGFPWGDLPQALWQIPWALKLAPWVGIDGVRLLMAGIGSGVAWVLGTVARRRPHPWAGLAPSVVAGVVWGLLLALPAPNVPVAGDISVGLVQGNVDQSQKWDATYREATLAAYAGLSRQVAASGADLIVWPETAVPLYAQDPSPERTGLEGLAQEAGIHLVFGAPAYVRGPEAIEYRNAVFLMDPAGKLAARYDKVHLVPFGEYVPLGHYLPFLEKLAEGAGDFSAGPGLRPLAPGAGRPVLGPLVCFEAIFPELAADYARAGTQVLVVLTNDAWFGRTPGPYQHLAFSAWRAAETGLPLVRAANTGISAFFDGSGRLLRSTPLSATDALLTRVSFPPPHLTPQAQVRPWVGPVSLVLALATLFAMLRFPLKSKESP